MTTTKLLRDMSREEKEQTVNDAISIIRQDYYNDVRNAADDVLYYLKERHAEGLDGEELREAMLEYLYETVDGTQRVIYTFQAKLGLIASDNSGAYIENYGEEGAVENGDINWSKMMYAAMEQDVMEDLEHRLEVDVNDPAAFFTNDEEEEE